MKRGLRCCRVAHLKNGCLVVIAASMAASMAACGGEDGDPFPIADGTQAEVSDVDPIVWVSPNSATAISVGDVVELSVQVNDPNANVVHFLVDGNEVAKCDTTHGEDECRRGQMFRATTTFASAGSHFIVAELDGTRHDRRAALTIEVGPEVPVPADGGFEGGTDSGTAMDAGVSLDRGFLDPDQPRHNVFGGVFWTVKNQSVGVDSPPVGSTTTVASCMQKYGKSIVKYADMYKISRASIIATAITESNCTNPAGSSDGLSSGPMQVTGSTCAATVSGYTSAQCKSKMYTDPDFSFLVGAKYIASAYQRKQHGQDPPKIAAAYNAGSIRQSSANRWHMIVTGNHIDRFVGAYNAYRGWENTGGASKLVADEDLTADAASTTWNGEHVTTLSDLPGASVEGQVMFVGEWASRNGRFATFRNGAWQMD